MGIALVAYSLMVDVFAELFLSSHPITALSSIVEKFIFVVCAVFVIAAFIGWFGVPLRERLARSTPVLSAVPETWDEFFRRIQNDRVALVSALHRLHEDRWLVSFRSIYVIVPCGRRSVRSGFRKIRS